jgi:hypothetical protein
MRRLTTFTMLSAAALLAFGVVTASANRGGAGRPGQVRGAHGVADGGLVTEAAKELDVTRAALKTAVVESAETEIDEAVEDDALDADEAADRKQQARENLRYAYRLTRAQTVASNLGITTARLNSGFRAARETLILRRIDEAVEDGDLEEEEAAELRDEVAEATLPGYKSAGRGFGLGGPGRGAGRPR